MVETEACGECGALVSQVPLTRNSGKKIVKKHCSLCNVERHFHMSCAEALLPRHHAMNYTLEEWAEEKDDTFFCFFCRTKCFYCHQLHCFDDLGSKRVKCTNCNQRWCYTLDSCANDENPSFCCVCTGGNSENDSINFNEYTSQEHIHPKDNNSNAFWIDKGVVLPASVCHVGTVLSESNAKSTKFRGFIPKEYRDVITVHPVPRNRQEPAEPCKCTSNYDANVIKANDLGAEIAIDERNKKNSQLIQKKIKIKEETLEQCTFSNLKLYPCRSDSCLNYAMAQECPSTCHLGDYCGNQRLRKREWKPLLVFETSSKGLGVKSLSAIQNEGLIVEYTGIAVKETSINNGFSSDYLMDWYGTKRLDASIFGSVARYINHSCDPNACIKKWFVDNVLRIGVFAKRDIKEFEEITYDYKWTTTDPSKQIECNCGAATCKKYLYDVFTDGRDRQPCTFAKFVEGNENESPKYIIDSSKLPQSPKSTMKKYLEYSEKNENAVTINYSNHKEQWRKDAKDIYAKSIERFDLLGFKDRDYIELLCCSLTTQVAGCRGRKLRDTFRFLFDTHFIQLDEIGKKIKTSSEGNLYELDQSPSHLLWICSRECLGTSPPLSKENQVITKPESVTKLGRRIKKIMDPHHIVSPYNSILEMCDINHSTPTPVDVVNWLFSENKNEEVNKRLNLAFDSGTRNPVIEHLQHVADRYFNKKDHSDYNVAVLKLALKLAKTNPKNLVQNPPDNIMECGTVPYCYLTFLWSCCNKCLGSYWNQNQKDDCPLKLQLPSQPPSSQESIVPSTTVTVNNNDDASVTSDMSNYPHFLKNNNPYSIQFEYSSLDDNAALDLQLERDELIDNFDYKSRVPPTPNCKISRVFQYPELFNYKELYDMMNNYFGLSEVGEFASDFKSKEECEYAMKCRFTVLVPEKDNIFLINKMESTPLGCLYLPKISLCRLIHECFVEDNFNSRDGEIDDAIINFMVEMFNFYENYDPETDSQRLGCPKRFLWEPMMNSIAQTPTFLNLIIQVCAMMV